MGKLNELNEMRLSVLEQKFQVLFENSPIGMAIIDHDTGNFLKVNSSLEVATGYSKNELEELSFWDITPSEYEEQDKTQLTELDKTGHFGPIEEEYIKKDGTRVPVRITGYRILEEDGQEVVCELIEDISERKAYERELSFLATHDTLTGLANRHLFTDRAHFALEYCRREQKMCGVILINFDKFKFINDSLGHHAGDMVLQQFSERIGKLMKRKTDVLARTGGDEFMIMLSLVSDASDVDMIAGRIIDELFTPFKIHNHKINLTCSIGSAVYPYHGDNVEMLIKHADYSLSEVKRSGGNGYMMWEDQMRY